MKAAVFLPNWVGDVVMATPTLRALRAHLGREARIVGILRPYLVDLLEGAPWLEAYRPSRTGIRPPRPNPSIRRMVRVAMAAAGEPRWEDDGG